MPPPRNERGRSRAPHRTEPPNRTEPPPRRVHERELLHVCGLAAVRALLARQPGRVERLFFEERLATETGAARQALARARKPYRKVEAAELARIAGTVHHGGIVAIARPQPIATLDPAIATEWARKGEPLLILDGIANPHNLGAIARSAAFFGIERIILADRPDQALPSDASYRIAEGGLDCVSLYRAALPEALPRLKPAYRVLGAVPGRDPMPRPGGAPAALVLGNEETGLSPAVASACDALVGLAGSGRIESLNVGVAAGILLYLATRR
jgi:TrmH RNA methyltransferase